MPLSLSFIPDGNRRWAQEKNKNTFQGHAAGADKIKEIIQWLQEGRADVDECVFWCLSRSNLERDEEELAGIFDLLKRYLETMRKTFIQHQVAFLALGEIHLLPIDVQSAVHDLEADTREFITQRRLGFGLAYDRDYDLIRSTREAIQKHPHISDPAELEGLIRTDGGYARGMRDPDILIRTGAKKGHRTSGAFMGRETALYFTETLWPDFSLDTLQKVIEGAKSNVHTHGL